MELGGTWWTGGHKEGQNGQRLVIEEKEEGSIKDSQMNWSQEVAPTGEEEPLKIQQLWAKLEKAFARNGPNFMKILFNYDKKIK